MKYEGIMLNKKGKASVCPICENEHTDIDGDYCQICGTQISNKCTDCGTDLGGEDRYCTLCGAQSTFLRDKLLKDWKALEDEYNNSQHILENINSETIFEPDFQPNYYFVKEDEI